MTIWRMAMRHGDYGKFAHDIYIPMGVAAITYHGIAEVDFTDVSLKNAKEIWKHLAPSQKSSLKHLCYDMAGGDTIFVKAGPMIVNSGVIRGEIGQRAYRFNHAPEDGRNGSYEHWYQQVPVVWRDDFVPIKIQVGSNPRPAIQEITTADARRILQGLDVKLATALPPSKREDLLRTESYFRATVAAMREITPRHNMLSNEFRNWLAAEHSIDAQQEQSQVDIRFTHDTQQVLAELKVCYGGSPRHAIREALGQLLEYNHYPSRIPASEWLIVLDCEPDASDRQYIELLRSRLDLPVFLGWQSEGGFQFSPGWPD